MLVPIMPRLVESELKILFKAPVHKSFDIYAVHRT